MKQSQLLTDLQQVLERDYVVIDAEGDGNNPASPVELCILEFCRGVLAAKWHWIINPGTAISSFVQNLHGITDAMAADAPRFREIEPEVRSLLSGRLVIAHGVKDDLRMLRSVMPDIDLLPSALIDTQRLARALMPGLPKYRLESVCEALGIAVARRANGRTGIHTAAGDAALTAAAFHALVPLVPPAPKHRRHVAALAQIVVSPKGRAAAGGERP